ncbi:hypothetical protein [Pseudoclavibacter sp. CFCC 11306]|uniref:hypothetical protein n=1 Tax=Pseudoclavibacter sp. CFCC 11306 TaxID=1564493 RepID=UPI001300D74E|nr:hypothetical protein [Pseudoclavibacter sp. CFCC 11306]KAB1658154.1 hypothetical protein F8O09_00525 [Pseudoclavibacter sp. CFCC 11306]
MPRTPKDPTRTFDIVHDEWQQARAEADHLKELSKDANAKAAKLKAEANRLKKSALKRAEQELQKAQERYEQVQELLSNEK